MSKDKQISEFVAYLLELNFNPTSIPRLCSSYYETLKFLRSFSDEYAVPNFYHEDEVVECLQLEQRNSAFQVSAASWQTETSSELEKRFYFQVPDYFEATVIIWGQITAESLERLIGFLELSKNPF